MSVRMNRSQADRRLRRVSVILLVFVLGATSEPTEEPLTPADFAVGRTLESDGKSAVQSVLLDFDVYRRSVEPALADLRVFDAEGQALPYAIRRGLPAEKSASLRRTLPLFRLDRLAARSDSEAQSLPADGYRIDAEISETGAIVSVHRGQDRGQGTNADAAPAGWLLDASDVRRALVGLDFDLAPGGGDFVSPLRIEVSNDMARFKEVEGTLALVRLDQEGHRIERTRFDIPSTRGRYLRITPIAEAPSAEILGVRARLAPTHAQPKRIHTRIPGRYDPHQISIVHFDLEGLPPIEGIRILLEEPNTLVEARLESAANPEGPWSRRFDGVLYFFEKGGGLRNPAIDWSAGRDRYIRLTVSSRGGGFLGAPPSLEITWRPEQLLFVQRGSGPAQLVIGRVGTRDGSFAANRLLNIAHSGPGSLPESTARLGPERTLAGDAALTVHTPVPWRTYGLWALLLASVGIVLGLSVKLVRNVDG